MIANPRKFYTGLTLMVLFAAVFIAIFMPLFGGKNGLQYLDNLYNSISKGSADYIGEVSTQVRTAAAPELIALNLIMNSDLQARQTAPLLEKAGARVGLKGAALNVSGNIVQILESCLDDARHMYANDGAALSAKYGYAEKEVLYNWYSALRAMESDLKNQKQFKVAKLAGLVNQKAVETAYNYYGIKAEKISDRFWMVLFSLIFYVAYTLWYGFGIMYLFEGWGMQIEH
jgi:hypothetical protein